MRRSLFILAFLCFILDNVSLGAVEVEKLTGSNYFDAVHEVLSEAKQSVYVVMYYVDFRKNELESKVSILVDDIVKARNRGVAVKVILDQTVVFERTDTGRKKMVKEEKNRRAFNYLKTNGINVLYDNLEIYTHGKCIVIDGEIVILGSHNWTKNSLLRSNEYSVLIKSKGLAEGLVKDFENIQIDHEASRKEIEEYISFSKDIMVNVLSGFVSNSNDYCWNVYLYLVGYYPEGVEIDFNYDKVAEYLGIKDKMSKEDYREMLGYQTLKELQDKYNLLTYTPVKRQNAKVVLKPYSLGTDIFEIPKKFWEYGWDMRLSLSGRYCYFINLIEGGPSHNPWAMSKKRLVERYKVGKERISSGMAELRHWNLAEVEYGDIDFGKGYGRRMPNRYRLKDLYRIEDFEKELNKLYEKYGEERVEQGRGYAKFIFSENNLVDVEEIIRMMDEYGNEKIRYAFSVISNRSEDNPKRSMAYVKGILRGGR